MPYAQTPADYLSLFGAPRIRYGGTDQWQAVEWQRPVALLAYLASRPGWHARESLADLLRPEANTQTGRAYLRRLLHRTREVMPHLQALEIEEGKLRWSGHSDVQEFEAAIEASDWHRAIELQRESLLQHVGSTGQPSLDDWFYEERLRLRQRLQVALMASINQCQQEAQQDCSELMQKLAEQDPMDEYVVQFLLGHARTPMERHAAVTAFQTLQRRMATELGQRPLPITVELHHKLQGSVFVDSRPPAPPRQVFRPVTEPAPPEGVAPLGRETEMELLRQLLRKDGVQLITIYGLGGVGKTVLARALYEELSSKAPAQHAWVELVATDTLHAMLDAIASQLGMPLRDGPVEVQLSRWLAERNMVVFLDNFEQLIAHAEILSRLIQNAPTVRFVVTSRETLRLPQEHSFSLSGLGHYGSSSFSAQLFNLHARRQGYQLKEEERIQAVALVEYLEGLPLAIELASDWVTLLSPDAILTELKNDSGFIDSIAGAHSSSRNMRSVFNTAWKKLDTTEQAALVSLSTVLGAMTLDTARAVSGENASVFLRLVGKALLQRTTTKLFKVHPLLRQFIQGQAQPEVLSQALVRHSEHFVAFLAEPPVLKIGRFMPDRIERLLPHAEDISKAWRFAFEKGRLDLVSAALPNLLGFLFLASRYEEAAELAEHAAGKLPPDHPLAATFASFHALAAFRLGRIDEADRVAGAALAHKPGGVGLALLHLVSSRLHQFRGTHDAALSHAQLAVEVAGDADDFIRMRVIEDIAICHWTLGQFQEAERCLLTNLTLAKQNDAFFVEARALGLLGLVKNSLGATDEGLRLLDLGVGMFRKMNDLYQIAFFQRGMSYVYWRIGKAEIQEGMAFSALHTFRNAGYQHEIGESMFALAIARDALGRTDDAVSELRDALRLSMRVNQSPTSLRCIVALGALIARKDRNKGVALMCFAVTQPAWRKPDQMFVEKNWGELNIGGQEKARARVAAAGWTLSEVCFRLLEE